MNDNTTMLTGPTYKEYLQARETLFHYCFNLELQQIFKQHQMTRIGQTLALGMLESYLFEMEKYAQSGKQTYEIMQVIAYQRKDYDPDYTEIIADLQENLEELVELYPFCQPERQQKQEILGR